MKFCLNYFIMSPVAQKADAFKECKLKGSNEIFMLKLYLDPFVYRRVNFLKGPCTAPQLIRFHIDLLIALLWDLCQHLRFALKF